jgi:hypothetical protein
LVHQGSLVQLGASLWGEMRFLGDPEPKRLKG